MSQLSYNGVSMQVVTVVSWKMEPVYTDGGEDALYTHHVLHVRGILAPAPLPIQAASAIPTIKQALLTPRKTLSYALGGVVLLQSPSLVGAVVDAKNGPHPIACNIVDIRGPASAIIEFVIETWVVDCSSGPSALLGQRWEMSEDLDELFYSTRTINGYAVFRTDALLTSGNNPDYFRARLFHPIPDGYKRVGVDVSVSEDNTRVSYQITDEQQTLSLGQTNPVAKIEGEYEVGTTSPLKGALFATSWATISVRVWGQRTSTRDDLVSALGIAIAAYGFPGNVGWTITVAQPGVHVRLSVDIVGKYAECEVGWNAGSAAAVVVIDAAAALEAKLGKPSLPANQLFFFPEDLDGMGKMVAGTCPQPLGAKGSRTDSLIGLIAQALRDPCAASPLATNPGTGKDTT
jgi:hypothetical protein